jgi:hypothetical protein
MEETAFYGREAAAIAAYESTARKVEEFGRPPIVAWFELEPAVRREWRLRMTNEYLDHGA